MDLAALIASVVAVVFTAGSLFYAWRRETRDRARFEREGKAELVLERHSVYENPNADSGWQVDVWVRNTGPAPARNPTCSINERDGSPVTIDYGGRGEIESGEATRLGADMPTPPQDGNLQVWIGWEDIRGRQRRDTSIRI